MLVSVGKVRRIHAVFPEESEIMEELGDLMKEFYPDHAGIEVIEIPTETFLSGLGLMLAGKRQSPADVYEIISHEKLTCIPMSEKGCDFVWEETGFDYGPWPDPARTHARNALIALFPDVFVGMDGKAGVTPSPSSRGKGSNPADKWKKRSGPRRKRKRG